MAKVSLPQALVNEIKNAPRGVLPAGIKAAKEVGKSLTGKNTYVSESPKAGRLGSTYRKIGPISVLKSASTPATRKQALASRRVKEVKAGIRKK